MIGGLGKQGAKHIAAEMLFELPVIERKGKYQKECRKEAGWERKRRGFRSAREEEEEDRCTRLCSTDVETSSVSVEGKRKFARRQVGLPATYVQLSPHIALWGFKSEIRMQHLRSPLFNTELSSHQHIKHGLTLPKRKARCTFSCGTIDSSAQKKKLIQTRYNLQKNIKCRPPSQ